MSFTPGPWHADGPQICGKGTQADVAGFTVATVRHAMQSPRFSMHISRKEAEHNAKLIAQAPAMYEFIKALENDDGKIPDWLWKLRNQIISDVAE